MISEELLKQAADEYSETLNQSADDTPHTFSPQFEKKMASIQPRAEQNLHYPVLRRCAAIVLIVLSIFAVIAFSSPQVYATLYGWFQEFHTNKIIFYPRETTPLALQCDYRMTFVPEGYDLIDILDDGTSKTYVYCSDGQLLHFSFHASHEQLSFGLMESQNYTQHMLDFGNTSAGIYIAKDPNTHNSLIIWDDPENHVLLCIDANATMEDLIAMAESVEKMN